MVLIIFGKPQLYVYAVGFSLGFFKVQYCTIISTVHVHSTYSHAAMRHAGHAPCGHAPCATVYVLYAVQACTTTSKMIGRRKPKATN
jgi:hypothetical protein